MEDYAIKLHAFLRTQDFVPQEIELDTVRTARKRDELGITSLGIIMLVANYMEAQGVPNAEFNPDWINDFETVDGILSVMRAIDLENEKRAVQQ